MTDIDRLYHKIKDRWGIRRTQVDATAKELEFLLQLLDMMEADEFGKDNNVPTKWISVKDRLPEHGQIVLAWECTGFVYVDKYDGEHDVFKIAYNNGGTVTHWQSLPEPPKEEE